MSRRRPIPQRRLACQLLTRPARTPAEAVAWLGAVQAQDYLGSLWAVGLRTQRATEPLIEQAVADGSIVRTHALRGTLQYIARDDLRWMLALVSDRVLSATGARFRELGLDAATVHRAEATLRAATADGTQLTRHELAAVLQRAGIATDGQRLIHLIARAELDQVLCSGGRRGKQITFASFDRRVPPAPAHARDAALAELARRYFQSRGPATLRDFVWWTGLPTREARAAIDAIAADLEAEGLDGITYWSMRARSATGSASYLLPAFDEYLVGYQDRHDVLDPDHTRQINDRGGMLSPCVVVDGQVVGTWRRSLARTGVTIELVPFRPWPRATRSALADAAERYAAFLGSSLVELELLPALQRAPPRAPAAAR